MLLEVKMKMNYFYQGQLKFCNCTLTDRDRYLNWIILVFLTAFMILHR